jgi:hypothetical protein
LRCFTKGVLTEGAAIVIMGEIDEAEWSVTLTIFPFASSRMSAV